jgi:hypothetical protein
MAGMSTQEQKNKNHREMACQVELSIGSVHLDNRPEKRNDRFHS